MDFRKIDYLKAGTPRQQAAYQALQNLNLLTILAPFRPVLAGTIPLDIDIPDSDLDIVCEAKSADEFTQHLIENFGEQQGFEISQKQVRNKLSVIARVTFQDFQIEIFGQNQPLDMQYAYRHLLVEARLLKSGGDMAKKTIRQLKENGLKTEPAFAHYFKFQGDPYELLYQWSFLDEDELRMMLNRD